jgi:hypothetical protein
LKTISYLSILFAFTFCAHAAIKAQCDIDYNSGVIDLTKADYVLAHDYNIGDNIVKGDKVLRLDCVEKSIRSDVSSEDIFVICHMVIEVGEQVVALNSIKLTPNGKPFTISAIDIDENVSAKCLISNTK